MAGPAGRARLPDTGTGAFAQRLAGHALGLVRQRIRPSRRSLGGAGASARRACLDVAKWSARLASSSATARVGDPLRRSLHAAVADRPVLQPIQRHLHVSGPVPVAPGSRAGRASIGQRGIPRVVTNCLYPGQRNTRVRPVLAGFDASGAGSKIGARRLSCSHLLGLCRRRPDGRIRGCASLAPSAVVAAAGGGFRRGEL